MNRFKAFFLIPAIAFLFSNCDKSDLKPKNSFQVSDYSAIHIGGDAVVEIQPGAPGNKTIVIEGNPR